MQVTTRETVRPGAALLAKTTRKGCNGLPVLTTAVSPWTCSATLVAIRLAFSMLHRRARFDER